MRPRGALRTRLALLATICLAATACGDRREPAPIGRSTSFDDDLAFLRQHTNVMVLADSAGGARVAVAPAYQGRVMTSTVGGDHGASLGWIGRAAIASRERQPHMNVFGGEDRFWLGPEGGQYSLYFKPGDPFDLDHWQVPEPLDWGAWPVASRSATSVGFRKRMTLVNHSRAQLDIEVDRTIVLLNHEDVARQLEASLGQSVRMVAFESSNTVANVGSDAWLPTSGLVSVWILGMFQPSPETTVAIPFVAGPESTLGPIVNDGPPAPATPPLGPFYELETSSPALSLAPGQRYTHVHRTIHLVGPESDLDRIARATLGLGLADLTSAFR